MVRIGTNAGHGHVYERPDGVKARCGGPRLCAKCAKDAAELVVAQTEPADVKHLGEIACRVSHAFAQTEPATPPPDETCVPSAGEPSFVLLGRDPQAPALVEAWAADRQRYEPDSDKPAKARQIADNMRAFKAANPGLGMLSPPPDGRMEVLKALAEAASELAQYASYSQIVGSIGNNSGPIRKWCDEVFKHHGAYQKILDDEEDAQYVARTKGAQS